MSKKLFVLLAIVMIFSMVASCAPAAPTAAPEAPAAPAAGEAPKPAAGGALPDVIKIGIVDSLTGGHSAYGLASVDGYKLALKHRPEVLGKKIEFIIVDTKSDKAEAALATSRAIADGAVGLLGTASSGFTIAMNEVAKEKGIPSVTNFSTNPLVTQDKPNAARACFIDPYQGWALAKFATEDLGAKTAVLLVDISTDYPVGVANFFRTSWNQMTGDPKTLLGYFSIMLGDRDFTSQLTAIKELNPDVIVVPDDYAEVGLILKQARELGITAPFLGSDAVDLPEIEEIAGDAIKNDFYMTTHWSPDAFPNETSNNFAKYYEEEYGRKPDVTAALSWDTFNMLVSAIEKAGSVDPAAITAALRSTSGFE
ncbi:MAG TPA: ABC transporter substrate-binding protein, partial [Bellilinea sp.]|nr:ABC transporter substrate-binding protein [Bellilinea sp.]